MFAEDISQVNFHEEIGDLKNPLFFKLHFSLSPNNMFSTTVITSKKKRTTF